MAMEMGVLAGRCCFVHREQRLVECHLCMQLLTKYGQPGMVNRQFYIPATPAAAAAAVECSELIGLHYAVAVLPDWKLPENGKTLSLCLCFVGPVLRNGGKYLFTDLIVFTYSQASIGVAHFI